MTVLIHRQTNPASQPTPLPPASPNATERTDHAPDPAAAPSKHPPPSVDAANAHHPKGNNVAAWQAHKSRHR
ncbi:MAG: hypothetical protein CMO03_07340 [Thalassospira sp.]|nr:hypothetical protein [Thalassospira sp.]MAL29336.1 hypothetical protein [Thalassospira sp.]OHZ04385.1 hypothetical protein BC440_05440 [Thalassospira sp. MIT1004]